MVSGLDLVLYITYFFLLFLSIFWLLVLFSSKEEEELRGKTNETLTTYPKFTAIVPAFNEEESIGGTLKSLIELNYPNDKKEIIIVNDGSTDKTQEIVEEFIKTHPHQKMILINQKNTGKGHALNVALEKTTGEFYACLDADSFVSPNALKVILPMFKDEIVAAVCPLLKVKKPKNLLQKVQWYEYIINMFYRSLNARIDSIHVTPGPFSVYRTKIIQDLGGYDETTITEDLEIAIRLQKNHYKILQTFETSVETVTPQTWKALFKQRVRWYKGSIDNAIVYKNLILNKKYGDFGMLRMPTIIASGVIAVSLSGMLGYELFKSTWQWFFSLKAINFDIWTLITNIDLNINLLSLPLAKLFIASTLMAISFLIMIYSFKTVCEKITNYGKTWASMFTYIFIYSLFISTVWVYIAFLFLSKKKNTWA